MPVRGDTPDGQRDSRPPHHTGGQRPSEQDSPRSTPSQSHHTAQLPVPAHLPQPRSTSSPAPRATLAGVLNTPPGLCSSPDYECLPRARPSLTGTGKGVWGGSNSCPSAVGYPERFRSSPPHPHRNNVCPPEPSTKRGARGGDGGKTPSRPPPPVRNGLDRGKAGQRAGWCLRKSGVEPG